MVHLGFCGWSYKSLSACLILRSCAKCLGNTERVTGKAFCYQGSRVPRNELPAKTDVLQIELPSAKLRFCRLFIMGIRGIHRIILLESGDWRLGWSHGEIPTTPSKEKFCSAGPVLQSANRLGLRRSPCAEREIVNNNQFFAKFTPRKRSKSEGSCLSRHLTSFHRGRTCRFKLEDSTEYSGFGLEVPEN